MSYEIFDDLSNVSSKYSGLILTEEQKLKALSDIGLDDPSINLLALYSLLKKKNSAISESLFQTWLTDLKSVLNLSSKEVVVDPEVSSGIYYDNKNKKPKTIKSALNDINVRIKDLENSVLDEESADLIKARIGAELFEDKNIIVSEETINERIKKLEMAVRQLTSDIFNTDGNIGDEQNQSIYRLSTDRQTQTLTIMDLINKLYEIHGGGRLPSHENIREEIYLNATNSKIDIFPGDNVFLFLNNNEKFDSHMDQNTRWSYRTPATITNLLASISRNTLNGTSYISVYINGIEQPKKVSIGPNALGSFDMSEMGISIQFLDSIAIKVTAESANSGVMTLDNTGLTVIKGPQ